jgi:DNA-binding transcriptional ArsR family regulator
MPYITSLWCRVLRAWRKIAATPPPGAGPRTTRMSAADTPAPIERLAPHTAERLADTMFALATPSRLQILACLRAGPLTVSEIIQAVAMEQSAVSHQLRVLRDNSVVSVQRRGRQRLYELRDRHVAARSTRRCAARRSPRSRRSAAALRAQACRGAAHATRPKGCLLTAARLAAGRARRNPTNAAGSRSR